MNPNKNKIKLPNFAVFLYCKTVLKACTGTFPLSCNALRTNLQQDIKMMYLIQNKNWKTSVRVSSGV